MKIVPFLYLLLWNQVDALQKHFKKDHVHMRLWTRLYGTSLPLGSPAIPWQLPDNGLLVQNEFIRCAPLRLLEVVSCLQTAVQ